MGTNAGEPVAGGGLASGGAVRVPGGEAEHAGLGTGFVVPHRLRGFACIDKATGDPSDPRSTDDKALSSYLGDKRLVSASPADASQATSGREPRSEVPGRLWLTGTGTPAALPGRAGPSNLVQAGEDLILVDCGNGAGYRMAELGFEAGLLSYIFLTHHHIDHNVDLAFLTIASWVQNRVTYSPPVIVGPPGTLTHVNRMLALHEYDLRVRMPHKYDPGRLAFDVIEVRDGTEVVGRSWRAIAFRVDHAPVGQAFGYRFEIADRTFAISGDTRPNQNLVEYCQGVDTLVHEVIYPGYGYPEYHTLSLDVGAVAKACRTEHLVLTHLLPGHLDKERWLEHVRPSFDGRVDVGHDLMRAW